MVILARTSLFIEQPISISQAIALPTPTHYTPELLKLAKDGLQEIFRSHYPCKESGGDYDGVTVRTEGARQFI